jgi:hypothetical protein
VLQHRKIILAGGRRFKYPLQYARHKLIINAVAISVTVVVAVLVIGWWQLYPSQNTTDFMYRITKVLPITVAKVDNQSVLYSDYLMKYRSSIHYLEQIEQVSLTTEDGKRQSEYIKQQSMRDSIADAYALKLANKLGISVNDSEVELFIKSQRQSGDGEISVQTQEAVLSDYYGWSLDEYRHVTKGKLLRQKVAYSVDKLALDTTNKIATILKSDPANDFTVLASTIAGQTGSKVVRGVSGWVPNNNQDGGLALEVAKLNKLQIASSVKSTMGDGYYFIKLLDKNSAQVSYEYIKVPLSRFTQDFEEIINSDKVKIYISVKL